MANVDSPQGFVPVGHRKLPFIPKARTYILTTGQTVYRGDPVIVTSAGTVSVAAANDGIIMCGIAAQYVSDAASAGGKEIMVYDDEDIIFEVQTKDSEVTSLSNVFNTADMITYAAGNSDTKQSIMTLDTLGTSSGDFLVIGLSPRVGNAWGEYSKVLAIFNISFYRNRAYTGI